MLREVRAAQLCIHTHALTRCDAVCRDHFTGKHHGQRFLPLIVYKYLSYLRRKGKLPAAEATAKCSVCQYRAASRAA